MTFSITNNFCCRRIASASVQNQPACYVLVQAAQAAQQQQGVSQLLPTNFAPAQLQNPTFTQFPASQVRLPG